MYEQKIVPNSRFIQTLSQGFRVCVCVAGARRGGFKEEENMGPALWILRGGFRTTGLETVTRDSAMYSS